MNADWSQVVLAFWFKELKPRDWFAKSDDLDATIAQRFKALHARLHGPPPLAFPEDAHTSLAAIIVLDQFSRNLFRGHSDSFASDDLALSIARDMVARGWDKDVVPGQRIFAYLPFEHSEDLTDQDISVGLIETLGDASFTRYAHAHRDVIRRFGRFPHRNAILGRQSTPEEQAYLSQPGSGF